jgi:hypothetical protein
MLAHASTEELEHRYRKAKDPAERSHLQIVWLLSEGRTTEEVCQVTGYSPGWVRNIAARNYFVSTVCSLCPGTLPSINSPTEDSAK